MTSGPKNKPPLPLLVFLLAFILRLGLLTHYYHGDIYNNTDWATGTQKFSLANFYSATDWPHSRPNQPPGTIYLFAGAKIFSNSIQTAINSLNHQFPLFPSRLVWFWENHGLWISVKLPSLLADLGIGYLIYTFLTLTFSRAKKPANDTSNHSSRPWQSQGKIPARAGLALVLTNPLFLTALWLFNPISWYNSSLWGQTDPVINILALAAILLLTRPQKSTRSTPTAICLFTLSLFTKVSLLIWAPLILLLLVIPKPPLKAWVPIILAPTILIFLLTLPFHPRPDTLLWLKNLYLTRILPGESPYLTVNAFNFWALLFGPNSTPDTTPLLTIPAGILGYILSLLAYTLITYKYLKNQVPHVHTKQNQNTNYQLSNVLSAFMLVAFAAFLFLPRMHERYLYPIFPLLTLLLALKPKLFIPYLLLSLLHLLNLYHLWWIPNWPRLKSIFHYSALIPLLSLALLVIFILLLLNFLTTTRPKPSTTIDNPSHSLP